MELDPQSAAHPFKKKESDLSVERRVPFQLPNIPHLKSSAIAGSPSKHPFSTATKKRDLSRLLVRGILLLILGGGLLFYLLRGDRGGILITENDPNLTVSINNRPIVLNKESNGYSLPLFAGEYRVTIQKPRYTTFTQDIKVVRGKTTVIRPAFAFQPPSKSSAVASVDYVRPSLDGRTVFYLGDNKSTLYRMEVESQVRIPLTLKPVTDIRDVQWSSEPSVALVTRSDGVYLREIPTYDFRNQTLVRIGGRDIVSPVWDPLNPNRIAAGLQTSSGERSLVFGDKRLTKLERKADISSIPNPKIVWSPNDSYLLLVGRASDESYNNIWIYTTRDGILRQLTNTGGITDASFSPDESLVLVQHGVSDLSLYKSEGGLVKHLDVAGSIRKSAWRDTSTLLLPGADNQLTVYSTSGSKTTLAFNFPSLLDIQGMYYFEKTKSLLFFTYTEIYTVSLQE